ncbi:hypothetical protein QFZ52_000624 [Arthrobacter woluwensis]|uniref:hypothetical protein n=1 Tax=Arthrobacter woluwensis TaxID=156980 RepID=UPI002786E846|nr:hypothetical protein [Arthrobacter woluwensis]MDQ0707972.1 hypothetical protein [Arthrobacter woluwensis]
MVMARAADIARHRFKTGLTIEGLARHEAAHVVVCHFTGGTVVSSDIYGQEKGAVTKYTHAGLEHMEYSEAVWCAMVTTAAGHVADQLEGDPNFSSTPDLVALNGLAYVFLAAGIEPPGIRSRHALRTLKGTGHGWLSSSPGSV